MERNTPLLAKPDYYDKFTCIATCLVTASGFTFFYADSARTFNGRYREYE